MATKSKDKPPTRTQVFRQSLRVVLTPTEIAERADRAAQLLAERDGKESEAKAAAKDFKGQIENMDSELRRLSNEVRTRATYSMVDCERTYDYAAGRVRITRADTGEVTEDRRMTDAERQMDLPFPSNGETEPTEA
jgi:hypothetical protein